MPLGCGGGPGSSATAIPAAAAPIDRGAPVARVGDTRIFAADVREQAARDHKGLRDALDDLITFEILASRAVSLPAEHEAAAGVKGIMVQRLLEREFEGTSRKQDIPEAELRQAYQKARDVFVHSRLVDVSVLSVYTGPRMKPAPRELARQTALDLEKAVAASSDRTREAFEAIGRDPAWAARKVQVVRLWQGTVAPYSERVGTEVQKLTKPGATTALVEDSMGYHIARYIGEQPAKAVSFGEAKPELADAFHGRWRQLRFGEFVRNLSQGLTIEVHPGRLLASGSNAH